MGQSQAPNERKDFSDAVQLLGWSSEVSWILSFTERASSHGTVQNLLSALARLLLKLDEDQLPLFLMEPKSLQLPEQIPADSLCGASQVLSGVQEKVVTWGLLCHLSLSVCVRSMVKWVRWLHGHQWKTAGVQVKKEKEQPAACFLPVFSNSSTSLEDDVIQALSPPRREELEGHVAIHVTLGTVISLSKTTNPMN